MEWLVLHGVYIFNMSWSSFTSFCKDTLPKALVSIVAGRKEYFDISSA